MVLLVADIGGTNTRLALIDPDSGTTDAARFENDDFGSFYEVLGRYFAGRMMPVLDGCCVAIAGPVTSGQACLTNRDWQFDVTAISDALPSTPLRPVRLINDLVALGYALPTLASDQVLQINTPMGEATNAQALIAGLGTGVNVCVVKDGPHGSQVIEAELGHGSLPSSVLALLYQSIGEAADQFETNEDLFSGGGLSRLYRILSGGMDRRGQDILAAYDRTVQDHVTETVHLTARLLGVFTRELVFQYLPFGGIHFAGGAARGILGSDARAIFLEAFNVPGRFAGHLEQVPIRLITDDGAALIGAARVALVRTGQGTGT